MKQCLNSLISREKSSYRIGNHNVLLYNLISKNNNDYQTRNEEKARKSLRLINNINQLTNIIRYEIISCIIPIDHFISVFALAEKSFVCINTILMRNAIMFPILALVFIWTNHRSPKTL